MAGREVFAGAELDVRESAALDGGPRVQSELGRTFPAHVPHLVVTPRPAAYGRLTRAEAAELCEALERWLGR